MDINKKIEEIRQKPEHERVRYVWGAVAISMFFVVIIWIISLKENFGGGYEKASADPIILEQPAVNNAENQEK